VLKSLDQSKSATPIPTVADARARGILVCARRKSCHSGENVIGCYDPCGSTRHRGDNRAFQGRSLPMILSTLFRRMLSSIGIYSFFFAAALSPSQSLSARPFPANATSAESPAIVIGFVGGFVAHDNPVHSEVQLAARLRKEYPAGVDVETFESYHGKEARKKILKLLDANHDGALTAEEKRIARIIIYGHSWGASASVNLARALAKDGIPVLLTLQVDSVSKFGRNDTIIPANVAQAANFYQTHGIVHGDHDIRAADPARTQIIGNFRFDYEKSSLKCSAYPWWDRFFVKAHTQIECDPVVWKQVEDLIRAHLPPATRVESAR
jgi:hypothetical protein